MSSSARSPPSSLLIDACRPYAWRDEFPPVDRVPAERRREVASACGVVDW